MNHGQLTSSFRDPDGFVLVKDNTYFRQVNQSYKEDYDHLKSSGLYQKLVSLRLLIPHTEQAFSKIKHPSAYKILKPAPITFISYPYEWTFSQLKDAALTTLKIQQIALEFGMTLKDASFFNIQFYNGYPVLIDTLSFIRYEPQSPWVPYRQFCEHFLAPLALMSYTDIRLGNLLRTYMNGIPLDLAHRLLPVTSYLSLPLLLHIHFHSRTKNQTNTTHKIKNARKHFFSENSLRGLLDNLTQAVKQLKWKPKSSQWLNYYHGCSYSARAFNYKKHIVTRWISKIRPKTVWDLGANDGTLSRILSGKKIFTVAFDNDPGASEASYLEAKKSRDAYLLPLIMDLTNPTPDLGFANSERLSLTNRGPAELLLALAFIHHLAIGNNLPLRQIASYFKKLGKWLIIEFIPKTDPLTASMLVSREDIFDKYSRAGFERAFKLVFTIKEVIPIKDSQRVLYLMQKK